MSVPPLIQLQLSIHDQSCLIYSCVICPLPPEFGTDIVSPNQLIWNCPKVKFWLGTYWFIQKTPCFQLQGTQIQSLVGELAAVCPLPPPTKKLNFAYWLVIKSREVCCSNSDKLFVNIFTDFQLFPLIFFRMSSKFHH